MKKALLIDQAIAMSRVLRERLLRDYAGIIPRIEETGALRRRLETIETLEFLVELSANESADESTNQSIKQPTTQSTHFTTLYANCYHTNQCWRALSNPF